MGVIKRLLLILLVCSSFVSMAQVSSEVVELKTKIAKFFENQDYESASECIKLLISKDKDIKDKSPYYSDLGTVLRRIGKNKEAMKAYNRAIRLNDTVPLYYTNRATLRTELGNKKGAFKDYSKALKIDNDFPVVFLNRAQLYEQSGDIDNALKDMEQLLKLRYDIAIDSNIAILKKKKGLNKEALADFDRMIRQNPLEAYLYNNRADTEMQMGFLKEALWDIERAIDLNELYPISFITKGEILLKMNKKIEARESFQKAIELGLSEREEKLIKELMLECK